MKLLESLEKEKKRIFLESQLYRRIKNKDVVVFSASAGGRKTVDLLKHNDVEVKYIIDNNSKAQQKEYKSVKIISPEILSDFLDLNDIVIIIGSTTYANEMRMQCVGLGIKRENIICADFIGARFAYYLSNGIDDAELIKENVDNIQKVMDILSDEESKYVYKTVVQGRYDYYLDCEKTYGDIITLNQYFDKEIMNFGTEEVFLDCGAYDGDTIKDFIKRVGNKYKKIYAFEPDEKIIDLLKENIKGYKNIEFINKGVSNKTGQIKFISEEGGGSHIADSKEEFTNSIQIVKGDELNLKPTYIKMDIEGEEMNALEGLSRTIKDYKPKLAICIYHRNAFDQLWKVPLYLKELCPMYKIKIRHHGYDTVCYAEI